MDPYRSRIYSAHKLSKYFTKGKIPTIWKTFTHFMGVLYHIIKN